VSARDGNDEIYVMNADGTAQTNLTNDQSSDTEPRWSPDGTQIAFESLRDGNYRPRPRAFEQAAPRVRRSDLLNGHTPSLAEQVLRALD